MAKTNFIDLDPEQEVLFYKGLTPSDRFVFGKVSRKTLFVSRKRVAGLTQKSLLPQISELWAGFSEEEKTAWSDAGAERNLNGWRAFVADQCARIKNDIAGVATPSLLHQDFVGHLIVESPATKIKIAQYHPNKYWVSQKVYGKKGMYEPVIVVESFALPLTLSINYKSNLVACGANPYAKFFATIWSSYQGVDRFTDVEIPFDLITDWKNDTSVLNSVIGHTIGYTLYIEINDLRGTLYCDNIKATHSGQNWVRDTICKDIDQGFTRAFYQVPKNWVAIDLPDGSWFGSVYPTM